MLKKYGVLLLLFLLTGTVFIISPALAEEAILAEGLTFRQATIKTLEGSVKIKKKDAEVWVVAYEGMILNQDDIIKTDADSSVDIVLPTEGEESTVRIYKKAEVAIQQLVKNEITGEENTVLNVAIGKILIKAAKLKGESRFEVVTPTSVVGVRGTEFEVTVSAATKFQVSVSKPE